jgi:hypothetical protein
MTPLKLRRIRQLLWLYFWLVILDGALRKWVLPGLSSQLLLLRDPIALLALWLGQSLLWQPRFRFWLQSLFSIALIAFVLALVVGHGDVITAAFGTRILLIHFPLIFLFAAAFDRAAVLRFAQALVILSIPMTLLIVVQSNLPPTHILNVAPGGEETALFSGALGRFRPPGTFSFINGLVIFYTLAAAALFSRLYGVKQTLADRLLIPVAGISLVVALPVSIARSLLFGYAVVILAVLVALLLSRTRLVPLLAGLFTILLVISIGTAIPTFQDASEAFLSRWNVANENEGGEAGAGGVFQKRVVSNFTDLLVDQDSVPLLGYGIGMGTNVGSQRLSGKRKFLISEASLEATLGELGPLLGFALVGWRIALGLKLLNIGLRAAIQGNRLPTIFIGASLLQLFIGNTSQPTSLGFLVVSAGLTWAAAMPAPTPGLTHARLVPVRPLPHPLPQSPSIVPNS